MPRVIKDLFKMKLQSFTPPWTIQILKITIINGKDMYPDIVIPMDILIDYLIFEV